MPDYLIDTGPLVHHLRDHHEATQLLNDLALQGELYVSVISRMEIIQGMKERERESTYELFDTLHAVPVDDAIADLAGEYLGRYRRLGHTLQIPDTLIAATAVVRSLTLVTYDRKGFPMPELRLATVP
jgi:hypothetical protein